MVINEELIEDITTTTFSIQGVPIKLYKKFLKYCEDNAQTTKIYKDSITGQKRIRKELCYSIALSQLLTIAEVDAKHQLLYDRLTKLEDGLHGNK